MPLKPESLAAVNQIFSETTSSAKRLGFDSCIYQIQMPIPVSRPTTLTFTRHNLLRAYCAPPNQIPPPKNEHSTHLQFIDHDLSIHTESSQAEAHLDPQLTGQFQKYEKIIRDMSGSIGRMVLLQRQTATTCAAQSSFKAKFITWIANQTHEQMVDALLPQFVPESTQAITQREKQVLRWTAEGKTAHEVATILAISERTVRFHLDNLVSKLNANNRVHAAVKAIALGFHL